MMFGLMKYIFFLLRCAQTPFFSKTADVHVFRLGVSVSRAQQQSPFIGTARLHRDKKIKFMWESFLSGWLRPNWWQFMVIKWRQRQKPYYKLYGQRQIKFEAHRRPVSLEKRPVMLGEISFYIARAGELIYEHSVQRLQLCEENETKTKPPSFE